jgi:hypothetical protein
MSKLDPHNLYTQAYRLHYSKKGGDKSVQDNQDGKFSQRRQPLYIYSLFLVVVNKF